MKQFQSVLGVGQILELLCVRYILFMFLKMNYLVVHSW
jgi:hypothetical protein